MADRSYPMTPKKRPNEGLDVARFKKRTPDSGPTSRALVLAGQPQSLYKLKILLPNGVTVLLKIPEGTELMNVTEVVGKVRTEYVRAIQEKKVSTPTRDVNWDKDLYFLDDSDNAFRSCLKFTNLELNKTYSLRLHDGSRPVELYQNMWDLTPDTDLLKELPEEYTFETALADLIDNSLQAVWSNGDSERRLIRVEVAEEKISIFDTGPGMDSTSIEKWGKMGASLHRALKVKAIGGRPPYLKPAFGMFGYGGFVASMYLGRHTRVSSKTKACRKVYMLDFERDALLSGSGSKRTWRTYGGHRDPTEDELKLSPDGSFTKVDIFDAKIGNVDISRLVCKLKDIYFPYIQCDELSKTGRTSMPIEFQVNGNDLAEVQGGEVAITNLHSCNGPEFVLQLRFQFNQDDAGTSSPGAKTSQEANARLKCVYLPVIEGKESIENILENLKANGYGITDEYRNFSHVSVRRLGRLLPKARWELLPFMDFSQRKVERASILRRCCKRVKCFIETDAGFNPTPSKTDFASENPYAAALKNLGSKQPLEKEIGVQTEIRRDGKSLTLSQLDKQYQEWLLQMHEQYDEEFDCGIDEPVIIINPKSKKELHISKDVVRVHKALRRKGTSWKSGQKIKVLKGACAGVHKNHVYAVLEYILLEGMQGDAGGDARIICRPLGTAEQNGCLLKSDDDISLDLQKSISIPINVIDSGKCVAIEDDEWQNQLEKQYQKTPSTIEILTAGDLHELGIEVALPVVAEVDAGHVPPNKIVAVVRPASYKPGIASKNLDQKFIMRDNFEMSLAITFSEDMKFQDETSIYSGREKPSSHSDIDGLYVFQPRCKLQPLFQKAGVYKFSFSIGDSNCRKCIQVRVKALPVVQRWELMEQIPCCSLVAGSRFPPISIAIFDRYDNQIPFKKVPKMVVKVSSNKGTLSQIDKWNTSTSSDKLSLILKDILIESSNLDKIRPSYEATLLISQPNGLPSLDIPFKVFPGPVEHIIVRPENFERQLIPGHVIQELSLELFDAYGNHLREDDTIKLSDDGFCFLDREASTRKVDDRGFIELGGHLKVTQCYGRRVSLSVLSDGGVVASKEWQIEKRQLRIASVIPESCIAGSRLENVVFEVVNSKGDVDVNIHDEDKIGQSHTLTITSQFVDIDEPVKYVFRSGRCVVRAITIPAEEGEFSFVAAHSRYPELQSTVKVSVELPPDMEYNNFEPLTTDGDGFLLPNSRPQIEYGNIHYRHPEAIECEHIQHHPEQIDYANLQHHLHDRCLLYAKSVESTMESFGNLQKELEEEIVQYGCSIHELEVELQELEIQRTAIESHLSELQGFRDKIPYVGTYGEPGKEVIRERIESKKDSAAAVVLKLFRLLSDDHEYKRHVIGVVALLGTVPTVELSRLLAEYLGDQLLAVVVRSYEHIRLLETYKTDGNLNRAKTLYKAAERLGESINGRYHVLCLEDIRRYQGGTDLQGKLVLPDPTLPNGETPAGFLGYAVNLINIDMNHLCTTTDAGYGLRETLFYRLFRHTQVYKSREDMKRAASCITDGAISLDGGIVRGDGALSLGSWEPDVIFPVFIEKSEDLSPNIPCVLDSYREKKLRLKETIAAIQEKKSAHGKATKKFSKRRDMYAKHFTVKDHSRRSLAEKPDTSFLCVAPISSLEEKPIIDSSHLPPPV